MEVSLKQSLKDSYLKQLQTAAWALTLAGLIPFIACDIIFLQQTDIVRFSPFFGIITYGAIILSFLAGTLWAWGLTTQGNTQLSICLLCLSILPSLSAWIGLLIGDKEGIMILIAAFCGLLGIEYALNQMKLIPLWWWHLRLRITIIVLGLLIVPLT